MCIQSGVSDAFHAKTPPINFEDFYSFAIMDAEPAAKRRPLPVCRDPGKRVAIGTLEVNIRDECRRAYLLAGPFCQEGVVVTNQRKFKAQWATQHSWLEYSPTTDAAYCLHCFVMGSTSPFATSGFSAWKRVGGTDCALKKHEGDVSSAHNENFRACSALMNEASSVALQLQRASRDEQARNMERLLLAIKAVRFLARQKLSFRGHDESIDSANRGNFLELLKFASSLTQTASHHAFTSPDCQKDISSALAQQIRDVVRSELEGRFYCLMLDETSDVSGQEMLTIIARYVVNGVVIERYLGMVHVQATDASSLYEAVLSFMADFGLSVQKIRGQSYDGAANMSGRLNGLQALILKENSCAYYIHCFNHQLQLALVDAASENSSCWQFYSYLQAIVNLIKASTKRIEQLRQLQQQTIDGQDLHGKGRCQLRTLHRAGDTRWSSHYASVVSLKELYGEVMTVMEDVSQSGKKEQRAEASGLLKTMSDYEFILILHLQHTILGISHVLSQILQRDDEDIVNAVENVHTTLARLREYRQSGFTELLEDVSSFCAEHSIPVCQMDQEYMRHGRFKSGLTSQKHYEVNIFNSIVDSQVVALSSRFPELTTNLLTSSAVLSPRGAFRAFDINQAMQLASMYPTDFPQCERTYLRNEFSNFIADVRSHVVLNSQKTLSEFARVFCEHHKHVTYPTVYRLITLVLTLPISTASAERSFSVLKLVKSVLRNKIGDEWLNSLLMITIERDVCETITDEQVIKTYQGMKTRRHQIT
jgi:hypothetical protein